ncbi:transketolase [Terriglobus roseus DSM 18391]|uniref:Transketolase n=1 Tax=Terriglobus roseus (strain DSM 18391 / NRRL B-41598 / KBS 63) TaxID=926566 RepID=I3ZDJ8_TERRK|nr:transketolase [Terriglobus roseus]AFL87316.1 transketolase [Terriglobus roseus DSM 18391]
MTDLDKLSIDTLRLLAVDAIEKAANGHPGAPIALSPLAYLLFVKNMKHDPSDPTWTDRDRFVLSNGHASMLQYGALHLSGYDLSLEDLKNFRQWHSKAPGHPEYGFTAGVEVTTGPLGQGLAMSVGMAIAEKHLAAIYNQPDMEIVNHHTYCIVGDGCLMEGISHESCSLAGTLGLGKLIVFYDDNLISLDGPTELSYTENVDERFNAYNWHVQYVDDGNDLNKLQQAINIAKLETGKPSLIRVRTIIGYGSPKAGTKHVHGEALGKEATRKTKEFYGFDPDVDFAEPQAALDNWAQAKTTGKQTHDAWTELFKKYEAAHPELAKTFDRIIKQELPADYAKEIKPFSTEKAIATRTAGEVVLQALGKTLPEMMGGAADLTSSTKTIFKDSQSFHVDPKGKNIFFGVREFGMCAAVNGMAAHGGFIPFGSTFFVFSDYARNAMRMAALMSTHSLFVFTHDSIGLGADGPTHQPVEHLMSLRAIPQLTDFRPADANETAVCYQLMVERKSASFMALSRQDLPVLDAEKYPVMSGPRKGAYVLIEQENADVIIVATGSEVSLVLKTLPELEKAGIKARVISMPSFAVFEEQDEAYKNSIFPHGVAKVAVEAGATMGWWKYVGRDGSVVGLDHFGGSAPGPEVLAHFGFTPENIVKAAQTAIGK